MSESILDLSDDLDLGDELGFCTWIETTKSSLFSRARCIQSEPPLGEGFWFRVSVPVANSNEFERLCCVLADNSGQSTQDFSGATPVLVHVARTEEILEWSSEKQAKFASALVNRFLRAYEHTYLDMSVPRHRLDGRRVMMLTAQARKRLEYMPVMLELRDVLEHYLPTHMDVEQVYLEAFMGSPEAISPSWRIIVDGMRHFESGNLREAVLCACSAAEIVATPEVERWLNRNTLTGGGENVRNAVREMGNPLRFELCIAGACSKAFLDINAEERASLLAELRRMNALRNNVVHRGEEPEAQAAATALRAAATFVCKMWLVTLELGGSGT